MKPNSECNRKGNVNVMFSHAKYTTHRVFNEEVKLFFCVCPIRTPHSEIACIFLYFLKNWNTTEHASNRDTDLQQSRSTKRLYILSFSHCITINRHPIARKLTKHQTNTLPFGSDKRKKKSVVRALWADENANQWPMVRRTQPSWDPAREVISIRLHEPLYVSVNVWK